jgi:hypothetical protein
MMRKFSTVNDRSKYPFLCSLAPTKRLWVETFPSFAASNCGVDDSHCDIMTLWGRVGPSTYGKQSHHLISDADQESFICGYSFEERVKLQRCLELELM